MSCPSIYYAMGCGSSAPRAQKTTPAAPTVVSGKSESTPKPTILYYDGTNARRFSVIADYQRRAEFIEFDLKYISKRLSNGMPTGMLLEQNQTAIHKVFEEEQKGMSSLVLGKQGWTTGVHFWNVELYLTDLASVQLGLIYAPNNKEDVWDKTVQEAGGWCLDAKGTVYGPNGYVNEISVKVPGEDIIGGFVSGDQVGILLEINENKNIAQMSFYKNNRFYSGFAFTDIPVGKGLFPAFSAQGESSMTILPNTKIDVKAEKLATDMISFHAVMKEAREKLEKVRAAKAHFASISTNQITLLDTNFDHRRVNAVGDRLVFKSPWRPGETYRLQCDEQCVMSDKTQDTSAAEQHTRLSCIKEGKAGETKFEFMCVSTG